MACSQRSLGSRGRRPRRGVQASHALVTCVLFAIADGAEPRWANPVIADVPAAFAQIDTGGSRLGSWSGEVLPYPFYSLNPAHDFGDNHFQGIQRLRAGPYIVVSGGNIGRLGNMARLGLPQPASWEALPPPQGDLIVARLASRAANGAWRSNLDAHAQPPASDHAVAALAVRIVLPSGTTLWHPGGISVCGDVLVVPVENYNPAHGEVCSQLLFYDLSTPEKPVLLPPRIDRTTPPVQDKAGGATMTRLRDGRFLVASRTTTHLSFYLSRSDQFLDGFEPRPAVVFDERDALAAPGQERVKFHGSSIHFAAQRDDRLFLVSFSRVRDERKPDASRYTGLHVATLFALDYPRNDLRAMPAITKVAAREFGADVLGYDRWGDFAAAAGLHVTDDGRLAIYAAPRWQVARVQPMTPADVAQGRHVRPAEAVFIPFAEFWPR